MSILEDIDLVVRTGECLAVIGPSGSGKSTLLRVMAGLIPPTQGSVAFRGVAGPPPRGSARIALQEDVLYRGLDVLEMLDFPADRRVPRAERRRDAARRARQLGVGRLLRKRETGLSRGERASVAVARALGAATADVIILDEPFARADPRHRAAVRAHVRRIRAERPDLAVVAASNIQADVMGMADAVVVLGAGRVVQIGSPDDIRRRPDSISVARFVGSPPMNLFPAVVESSESGPVLVMGTDRLDSSLAKKVPEGVRVLVGVAPADLRLATAGVSFGRVLHATVGTVDPVADIVYFGLGSVAASAFAAIGIGARRISAGDRLELSWVADRTCLFEAASGRPVP